MSKKKWNHFGKPCFSAVPIDVASSRSGIKIKCIFELAKANRIRLFEMQDSRLYLSDEIATELRDIYRDFQKDKADGGINYAVKN